MYLARSAEGARAPAYLIATSSELYERHLIKMARLTDALADALVLRGQQKRQARVGAQLPVMAFDTAYADSIDHPRRRFAPGAPPPGGIASAGSRPETF